MNNAAALAELRYELKLTCAAAYLSQVRSWLRLHPEGFRVAYPTRTVNNLYLDTPDLNSFNANLASVGDRQKLRVRWYDTDKQPILELKYKHNLLGGKKQQILQCELDWQRPYPELLAIIQQSAGAEWQQWLTAASQPTLINHYRREYYVTIDDAIRATLDYAQVAYDQRWQGQPNFSRAIPIDNFVVLELKSGPDQSDRLQWAVGRFPIPRTRHSKYVNGMLGST